jgi:hypothetical protein
MSIRVIIVILIVVALTAIPASAQLIGDLNCNGWAWELVDAVLAARILIESCDIALPTCPENSDIDRDGRAFTVGDLIYYFYLGHPPNYGRHPLSDTIAIESIIAHPGENISLPVWISTVDIIMGFEFLLELDTDYLAFDSLIADEYFYLNDCIYYEHIYFNTPSHQHFPVIDEPGVYHVCDIFLTVNPAITQPVTTPILFSSIPPQALYSGFANSDFFLPVFVDAEIEILPLTEVESEDGPVPTDFTITAYPNPFNNALNISVISDRAGEITVYDIMGRPIKRFDVNAGITTINRFPRVSILSVKKAMIAGILQRYCI